MLLPNLQAGLRLSTGLAVAAYPLPDDSLWEEPDIGTEPIIDGPPTVIGGVVQ